MNEKWQLLLVALGFVLISLSPTVPNMYASIVSGLAFIGLGWYLIRKDCRKVR